MATWQKVLFSGSAISELQNDSNFQTLAEVLALTQSLSSSMSDARGPLSTEVDTLSGSLSTARVAVVADISGAFASDSASIATDVTAIEDFSSSLDETFLTDEELNQGTGSILNNASASVNVITMTKGDGTTFDVEVVQSGVDTSTASFAQTAPFTGVLNKPADLASGSSFTSPSQGTVDAGFNGVTTTVDLGVQTGDSPTFAGVTTTGNAQIGGNLKVDGSTTTIGSDTASLADKFITLASGSTTAQEGGIVISQQSDGTGEAFGYDTNENLWGFEGNFNPENTGIAPDANMQLVTVSSSAPGDSDPTYGGINTAAGQFWVDTSTNFIWLSTPGLIYQDTHYLTGWSNSNYIDTNLITNSFLTSGSTESWAFGYRLANTLPTNGSEFTLFTNGEGAVAVELESASQWFLYTYTASAFTGTIGSPTEPSQTSPSYWLWTYDAPNETLEVWYNGTRIFNDTDQGTEPNFALPPTGYAGQVTFGNSIESNKEPMNSSTGVSALFFARTYLSGSINTTAYNNNGDITSDAQYDDVDSFFNVNATGIVDIKENAPNVAIEGTLTFTSK